MDTTEARGRLALIFSDRGFIIDPPADSFPLPSFNMDSLDSVEVVMALEEEFDVEIDDDKALDLLSGTWGKLVEFAAKAPT